MYGFRWYGSGVYALRVYVSARNVGSMRVPTRVHSPDGPVVYGRGVYLILVSIMVSLQRDTCVMDLYVWVPSCVWVLCVQVWCVRDTCVQAGVYGPGLYGPGLY